MKIGSRDVGYKYPPYLIAEACNNFNSDPDVAAEMILRAKEAGCDAIKFQMRLRKDRLSPEQHYNLKLMADRTGIEYLCTAFDYMGLEVLQAMGVRAYKIGSAEAVNHAFVSMVFRLAEGKPVMVSTGACTQQQVNRIWMARLNCILMQCTSIYPTPPEKMDLGVISTWHLGGFNVGLSSHCPFIDTSFAAIALGACVIEHHFTLDPTLPGPDQSSSLDYSELCQLVQGARRVWEACQGDEKVVYPEELEKMRSFR